MGVGGGFVGFLEAGFIEVGGDDFGAFIDELSDGREAEA